MNGTARRKRRIGWFWTTITAVFLLVYLFPLFWMISASFQPNVTSVNIDWIPAQPSVDGYAEILESGLGNLGVSVIVALGSALLTLIIAIPAGYALSRLRSRTVGVALILLLLAQMIPSIVLANSFYAMFSSWGLLNTYLGLIFASTTLGVPFATILLRSFMLRLDNDVVEAATLDGLGPLGTLVRIVVPLSRNAIITAAVFTFLFSWGDLLFGLTLVTQEQMRPITVFIYALTKSQLNTWASVMAASLIASIPAVIVIFTAQRYIKSGIAVGTGR